jgi:predicted RNA-binding protein (virulence factor B family)
MTWALNRHVARVLNPDRKDSWRKRKLKRDEMTVLIYVDTSKQVGDKDHIKVFANQYAAKTLFEENDSDGVAFVDLLCRSKF